MNTPRGQRGAMAITMALLLTGLIFILGLVTVAQYFWAKRDAQKVADLAALSAAQHFQPNCGSDAAKAASVNASMNWGTTSKTSIVPTCGNWDPSSKNRASTHFEPTPANAASANAIQVDASIIPTMIFSPAISGNAFKVRAKAIAISNQPIATFSVGTTLAKTAPGSTLGRLLGEIGIPIDQDGGTSLAGYDGLAKVRITPAGLLEKLGIPVQADATIGDLYSLADVDKVSVGDLLDAAVKAAGQDQLTTANVSLLSSVLTKLDIPSLPDITLTGENGLLATLMAPAKAAQSAALVHVNAMQTIITTLWIATHEHALQAKESVNLGPLVVDATTKVIEPPTIAVGGPGTTAYTAQIRAFLNIQLNTNDLPLLGGLLGTLAGTEIKLNLPVAIDLVGAQATLVDPQPRSLCTNNPGQQARFHVHSAILKMCVGNITAGNAFSKTKSCEQIPGANENVKILNLKVAGSKILGLNTHFHTEALTAEGDRDLSVGDDLPVPEDATPLDIGTSFDNLFTALTRALVTKTAQPSAGQQDKLDDDDADALAQELWNATDHDKNRGERLNQALNNLKDASSGLQGLLAAPVGQLSDILGNTLSLDVPGLLGGVGGLLTSVVGGLTDTLNTILCGVGTQACLNVIASNIRGGNTDTYSGSFISKLGLLANILKGPLDQIGKNILTPLVEDQLGMRLGQTDVHFISLQCRGAQLVY